MTDKQIIIDGIDVSWCEHFEECETKLEWSKCLADCYPYPEGTCYGYCDEHPNCYYKQLKRAEQTMQEIWNRLGETSDKLLSKEQECEELKIYIESNEQQVKEVETLVMDNDRLINELDNLKTCLTEIKEIAEAESYLSPQSTRLLVHKILQKISECEVDINESK